jgi:hypothetical protein
MPFKDGNLVVQELSSQRYKDRDDEDLARAGKKQHLQVSSFKQILIQTGS